MKNIIATRELFYAIKGTEKLKSFFIKISQPYFVDSGFKPCSSKNYCCVACDITLEGLDERQYKPYGNDQVFGIDSVQALNIATNLEPLIEWISKQFDVYWEPDEPYFDQKESIENNIKI